MEGTTSKQIILSVLGIAVLIIAVVGVSFAFFSYSKEGMQNNVFTSGSIFFNFTDTNQIKLSNQFPLTDSEGLELAASGDDNSVLNFTVVGYDGSGKGISYTVYAYPGEEPKNLQLKRLQDNEIKLFLTSKTDNNLAQITNYYEKPKLVGDKESLQNGVVIATGRIDPSASDASKKQTDTYSLRMWIAGDVVLIVDGDDAKTDLSTHTYTTSDYSKLYYSLKLQVKANTTTKAE